MLRAHVRNKALAVTLKCWLVHQVQANQAGKLDAIIVWWQLDLDQAGAITLDTAPAWTKGRATTASANGGLHHMQYSRHADDGAQPQQQWRDHWKQCWTSVMSDLHVGKITAIHTKTKCVCDAHVATFTSFHGMQALEMSHSLPDDWQYTGLHSALSAKSRRSFSVLRAALSVPAVVLCCSANRGTKTRPHS